MRTATKHALEAVKREVDTLTAADADSARKLFDVAETLASNKQLAVALVDRSADAAAKRALARRVFGERIGIGASNVLDAAVSQKWQSERQLVQAIQDAGIRAVAQVSGAHERIGAELDQFLETISSNGELELAFGSRLADGQSKVTLLERLFARSLSAETLDVLRSLLTLPSSQRIRRLAATARESVADQAGRQVAIVTVARALPEAQLDRLRVALTKRFGHDVAVNQVIDPSVVGGMRVEFGDEVIDDTAAARLKNLRLQLA
ncbi:F0F1 ATP synthase subunit delta [Gulosibacter sediminis]|uniref:F0F1 ATP synthase subunit delta n=1 Tax=Gulosibacter sediminis TaxID=1729695 RepID=UPI0024A9259C|nr:F0F1 ATP synthase subunit delta [Gulosibacter sediminis]